jgi:signal transduction histidine kinase
MKRRTTTKNRSIAFGRSFIGEAAAPIEDARSRRLAALLERRTGELAAARARIEALQAELDASERHHAEVLARSRLMELRLRHVSHRLLSAQEEERLRISRDLHDAIGQTLTGINVGLATLKNEAAADSRKLARAISRAQQLVERSMRTVHKFAWELRPTLLDDLGLVPALRSYAKTFSERTGIRVRFAADAKFGGLDADRSTALFRVAQGALSNVERHARAGHARLVLSSLPGLVRLEVRDNGRSFDVRRMDASKANKHLGLLVMRERVEMVGGSFSIESTPRLGTTVRADVPLEAVARD